MRRSRTGGVARNELLIEFDMTWGSKWSGSAQCLGEWENRGLPYRFIKIQPARLEVELRCDGIARLCV